LAAIALKILIAPLLHFRLLKSTPLIPPIEIELREGFPASQDERRRALSWAAACGISSFINLLRNLATFKRLISPPPDDFPCAVKKESGPTSYALFN
jgi:hypothetical protein